MTGVRLPMLRQVMTVLTAALVLHVTAAIVGRYGSYFPPDFDSEFLHGRDGYFFGAYQWVFYPHLVSGPLSLVFGLILLSDRFRNRWPRWHRRLGRIQAANVLLLVAPSGLAMAYRADAGPVAAWGFSLLAVLTGATVALGWRAAVQRRFVVHRRWMQRCFVLLCSAVTLRLTVGAALVVGFGPEWFDPLVAWTSCLVPLGIYEFVTRRSVRSPVVGHRLAAVLGDERPKGVGL